jgi:hypothetical protein
VPASGDSEDDCGEADGMYIGRGNRSQVMSYLTCILTDVVCCWIVIVMSRKRSVFAMYSFVDR